MPYNAVYARQSADKKDSISIESQIDFCKYELKGEEYKTYIDGLKDIGGALEFTFNLTEELYDAWDDLMTAYETAKTTNKAIWFEILIPGLTNAVFFTGNPSAMGLPETSVSAVLETTNYITPTNAPEWFAKVEEDAE